MTKSIYLLLFFVVVLAGCKKDPEVSNGSEFFVSATPITTYTKAVLQGFATLGGYATFVPLLKYDVDFYKIVYKTTYKGNTIDASGLLAIPKNTPSVPSLLSAQHGTMVKQSDAPSNFPAAFTGLELFAAAGFVTVIPDFIGYGSSSAIAHPYYDQQHSGTAVTDMLKAVKFYLGDKSIAISNRLFLVGYSEGGYVTMAAQKEIETHPEHNLTLTAAAAGAGGYDLPGMLSSIATTTSYSEPSFLALLIRSYNTTYDWNRPYTDFFREPYATRIPTLLTGNNSQSEVNSQLSTSPAALFNPTFYANLQIPTGEPVLRQKLQSNSFLTWVPRSPTRLYHGTSDTTVYYQTSVTTINAFKAAGAPNVELISFPNLNHQTTVEPMMLNVFPWFESLNQ